MAFLNFSKSRVRDIAAAIALATTLGVTALASIASRYGWSPSLELLSHFQVQYFLLSAIAVVVLVLSRRPIALWIGLFCSAVLAVQVVPWYLPPMRLLPQPDADLRVLVSNLHDRNQNFDRVLSFVRQENPDFAVFIEVNAQWTEQLDRLRDILPYQFRPDRVEHRGIAVYSKRPLLDPQLKQFDSHKTASIVGELEVANRRLSIIATHPLPPVRAWRFHLRNQHFDRLGEFVQTLTQPTLVLGDFNTTMWSPYYKRLVRRTGLKNARQGFGILPSWPTRNNFNALPFPLARLFSIPIDHCLLTPDLRVANVRTGPDIGSDHLPLLIDLHVSASR
ncbi:hypothetical protein AY599_12560 [Leptolyngbya valderiana BDU 20041]|nr:endonuclease/exonuclease/phosphatase family protein [Geitlerinema sp. CS-897]OAB62236.1 hypothetical protein AY599_12560 [Leptolyngbya valderiana BDU 20041]PPT09328.1 hypothetical protein CKA32_003884 [Geitlerinema sp. FC II]